MVQKAPLASITSRSERCAAGSDIIVICGPTASGKTAAALEVAEWLGGEIVSADSGQIYRGMNIGTAKPTREEQTKSRFHLIDIVDPNIQFSAADFRLRALDAIQEIHRKGKRALVVGGTGLYLRALEHGLFEGPGRDEALRADLERRIQQEGVEALHRELQDIDPTAAASIPSKNRQRIIRAIEVYRLTGRPISEFWKNHQAKILPLQKGGRGDFLKVGLDLPRDELNRRIEERVQGMIEQGLLAEVHGLLDQWGPEAPGLKLIGYREIVGYLQKKMSLEAAVALVIRNTRQYAKRQRTWFQKDEEIQWFKGQDRLTQYLTKK